MRFFIIYTKDYKWVSWEVFDAKDFSEAEKIVREDIKFRLAYLCPDIGLWLTPEGYQDLFTKNEEKKIKDIMESTPDSALVKDVLITHMLVKASEVIERRLKDFTEFFGLISYDEYLKKLKLTRDSKLEQLCEEDKEIVLNAMNKLDEVYEKVKKRVKKMGE
jgi:hypothetical protein